jgi:hypothetical protein
LKCYFISITLLHSTFWVRIMPKTDTFFIRATKDLGNTNAYHEKSIDLGSYVNALEKSVLRIKSVQVAYTDNTGRSNEIAASSNAVAQFQLLTQSQDDIILPSNSSVVASGRVSVCNRTAAQAIGGQVFHDLDIGPHTFGTEGYLVAVDEIYLGGAASSAFVGDVYCSIILECQVETLTQSKAMALALSQQGA